MVKGEDGIYKTRLRNGLEVRLKPIHTAPLISSWIWYRVGSRAERPGITGISHWVEHMLFKGTPTFPGGILDRAISRDGGFWNAFTWIDWTAFFETMPAARIELALQLEADRMVNSIFDPREVESERYVIISERQGSENEPTFRLTEEVQATAFRVSPYHHLVIGDMADLQTISREDLYQHYRTHYVPSNAVLAIAGDFSVRPMLDLIRKHFGGIPKSNRPEIRVRPEPEQTGEKRVAVHGAGETAFIEIAYHVPNATDPDFAPLMILDSVLTGASNMSLFGGGISNKTCRLYRALIEGGWAAAVSGSMAATIHPYLYSINVTVLPQHPPEKVLEVFDSEVQRLLDGDIDPAEVEKAKKQARALFAYSSESITNQGLWMGYSEMFADYAWFVGYLEKLEAVSVEQMIEASRKYLSTRNRTVGIYYPTKDKSDG